VTQEVLEGKREIEGQIPERRPDPEELERRREAASEPAAGGRLPVWRCRVCGYLAAREKPPRECPVCKATADRFEPFPLTGVPPLPVWRCRVCGYLAAREKPPRECPVCKATADRFEPFPL